MRKRLSKQAKRKAETEFKIYLNDDDLHSVSKAANACGLSRTAYIQQSAVASARNQHMVMDKAALNHIIQLLTLNYELLQEITETSLALPQAVLSQMALLERQVLAAINGSQPKHSAL